MKITKFVHSCLMVEMPEPVNRTVIFDPGSMSESALNIDQLMYLDDIVITHNHGDHLSEVLIKKLVAKFPDVRITTTEQAVKQLSDSGIKASHEPPEGFEFFEAPHEHVEPLFQLPENIGVHYLDLFTHPGDSHSFKHTKKVLALPVTAPWGSTIRAANLALRLKPKYVLPIHDWHWREEARQQTYKMLEEKLGEQGIKFIKLETGQPVVLEL